MAAPNLTSTAQECHLQRSHEFQTHDSIYRALSIRSWVTSAVSPPPIGRETTIKLFDKVQNRARLLCLRVHVGQTTTGGQKTSPASTKTFAPRSVSRHFAAQGSIPTALRFFAYQAYNCRLHLITIHHYLFCELMTNGKPLQYFPAIVKQNCGVIPNGTATADYNRFHSIAGSLTMYFLTETNISQHATSNRLVKSPGVFRSFWFN